MSSSFWLLGIESRDFSQAEKERIACKAGQVHKITTLLIFHFQFSNKILGAKFNLVFYRSVFPVKGN